MIIEVLTWIAIAYGCFLGFPIVAALSIMIVICMILAVVFVIAVASYLVDKFIGMVGKCLDH